MHTQLTLARLSLSRQQLVQYAPARRLTGTKDWEHISPYSGHFIGFPFVFELILKLFYLILNVFMVLS